MSPSLEDRFVGCLVGLAIGDALGAPYEGLTSEDIFFRFGEPTHIATNPDNDTLFYTDDTEMMLGVAETLIEEGEIREETLMANFVKNYHPERGYGRGARQILEAAQERKDWREVAATIFPGGSLGNGAAMRVAPVGLFFHQDETKLWEQARRSGSVTHGHPVGVEGGQLMALAISCAMKSEPIKRNVVLKELLAHATTEPFQWAIRKALQIKRHNTIASLGSTLHADRSVITAIVCFLDSPTDFNLAVGRAISLGDDTDTLAAMTGATLGAHCGVSAIPKSLIEKFENQTVDVEAIQQLGQRLCERFKLVHAL
jgi:poly(ADP-ribose) glycohydrolase ARH3